MRLSALAVAGTLAVTALAAPHSSHVLHERRDVPLRHWGKRDKVPGKAVLPVRIGLTQRNLDKGEDLLMEVSRHDSPKYGQHYTAEEVSDLFAPSTDAVEAVRQWLEQAGIAAHRVSQSVNKQWIQFDATTDEAEELFKTDYHVYEHHSTGRAGIACDEYHVPAHVQEHIDYITPGTLLLAGSRTDEKRALEKRGFKAAGSSGFLPPITLPLPQPLTQIIDQGLLSMCDTAITPPCIAAMYNISQADKACPGNELGIFEETDFYAAEDLVLFFSTLAQNIPVTTRPDLEGIDGGTAPMAFAGGESDLDFQISYPIIYPQNSILFQTDDIPYEMDYEFVGIFNNFLAALDGSYCPNDPNLDPQYPDPQVGGYKGQLQCGVYKPTNVISVSYGEQEDDLPASYQKRQCNEFMKLGMQGTSIVFASGDSGVAARGTDDGNADGCLGDGSIFNPDFPATCPFLTTAGATYLPSGADPNTDQEVAVTRFPSGGGFSNIYNRPSYQNESVMNYFATADPPYPFYSSNNNDSFGANGGIYNRDGRGYPDVSAVGDNILIFNNGAPTLIGGTSASAPVFAAILNRINEERLAVGKSTVGFVNPTLYANPQVLNDITVGSNPGCNTDGFSVAKGWDPVTGLGTPNYPAMLELFMSMQ
ncbi:alkaline serine protease AorO [Saccharata proteae CBS 121410]|uniref:tripeptidyl-peptidase II n=1 Tax=Saccharata proteae CBS 121410 TaxID=1314787 RepID=A0A9P4HX87_9PEZI|nr:alkaline serine protease AorO [Saccharata proteae CBS 121410]